MGKRFFIVLLFLMVFRFWSFGQTVSDFLKAKEKLEFTNDFKHNLVETAKLFVGIPYVAGTLEKAPEQLVIDFTGLDCITFVENAIALTLAKDESNYRHILQNLRYRQGIIDGYPSRIHYLSEWLVRIGRQGIFTQINNGGDLCFEPDLHFMSSNPKYYAALKNDSTAVNAIAKKEAAFNDMKIGFHFYSKNAFEDRLLQHGDIVAFKSKKEGLDFDHLGLVVVENGQKLLLHASLDYKKVLITKESVKDYLMRIKKFDGVSIVR